MAPTLFVDTQNAALNRVKFGRVWWQIHQLVPIAPGNLLKTASLMERGIIQNQIVLPACRQRLTQPLKPDLHKPASTVPIKDIRLNQLLWLTAPNGSNQAQALAMAPAAPGFTSLALP